MNKALAYTTIFAIPALLFSACGSIALGVQPLGGGSGSENVATNTLLYILMGAVFLITLVALMGRKSS